MTELEPTKAAEEANRDRWGEGASILNVIVFHITSSIFQMSATPRTRSSDHLIIAHRGGWAQRHFTNDPVLDSEFVLGVFK